VQERWTAPTFRRRAGKPHRVLALTDAAVVAETRLPGGGFRVANAFNDTSLVTFPDSKLAACPALFGSEVAGLTA
jgi:hypothetical protein